MIRDYLPAGAAPGRLTELAGALLDEVPTHAFPGYLRQSRALLAARPAALDDGPAGLDPDFEALRWFPLPPACISH